MEISSRSYRFIPRLRKLFTRFPELVVPSTCLTCDTFVERQGGCCPECWGKLQFITKPLCPVMGTPFAIDMGEAFLSAEAIADPPPFERLRSVLIYNDLARQLVSSIKYSDRTDLLVWVARWMKVTGKELLEEADMIVPVPLHRSRLRQRRFNQAAELARQISKESRCEYTPDVLLRKKATRQQVGLSEAERARNVSGAFVVPEEFKIETKGRRVLLVDDVYTTGATVKSATRALRRGGADHVDVLVFAKVETEAV